MTRGRQLAREQEGKAACPQQLTDQAISEQLIGIPEELQAAVRSEAA
jgi:hypothetical protein